MKQSNFLNLNVNDLTKGFIVAFVSAALTGIVAILETSQLPQISDLKAAAIVGLTAGLSYLLKNILTNKAEARLAQAGRLPAICAERFPNKDTSYIKDTVLQIDTFLSGEYIFDTARINDTLYEVKYKPVVIYKTKYITKVERVEDVAKIEALRAFVSQLEAQKAVSWP